jgi:hypothetical protein
VWCKGGGYLNDGMTGPYDTEAAAGAGFLIQTSANRYVPILWFLQPAGILDAGRYREEACEDVLKVPESSALPVPSGHREKITMKLESIVCSVVSRIRQ